LEGLARDDNDGNQPGRQHEEQNRPTPAAGAWSAFQWLPYTDGKARRVEPGTFPLVTRLPDGVVRGGDPSEPLHAKATSEARVMRLRGYGNSIVPQLAAEFIKAYLETQ